MYIKTCLYLWRPLSPKRLYWHMYYTCEEIGITADINTNSETFYPNFSLSLGWPMLVITFIYHKTWSDNLKFTYQSQEWIAMYSIYPVFRPLKAAVARSKVCTTCKIAYSTQPIKSNINVYSMTVYFSNTYKTLFIYLL